MTDAQILADYSKLLGVDFPEGTALIYHYEETGGPDDSAEVIVQMGKAELDRFLATGSLASITYNRATEGGERDVRFNHPDKRELAKVLGASNWIEGEIWRPGEVLRVFINLDQPDEATILLQWFTT